MTGRTITLQDVLAGRDTTEKCIEWDKEQLRKKTAELEKADAMRVGLDEEAVSMQSETYVSKYNSVTQGKGVSNLVVGKDDVVRKVIDNSPNNSPSSNSRVANLQVENQQVDMQQIESLDITQLGMDEEMMSMQGGTGFSEGVDSSGEYSQTAVGVGKSRVALTTERKQQKKLNKIRGVLISADYGVYACDMPVSKKVFETRDRSKPAWAVRALVLLRDQGVCQVCGDEYGRHGEVVRRKPLSADGQYDEATCVSLCVECMKVWVENRNFYNTELEEFDRCKQYLCVLKKRRSGSKSDVKCLSSVGMDRYRELSERKDKLELELTRLRESRGVVGKIEKVGGVVQTRMGSEEFVWDVVSKLGKKLDVQSGDVSKVELPSGEETDSNLDVSESDEDELD